MVPESDKSSFDRGTKRGNRFFDEEDSGKKLNSTYFSKNDNIFTEIIASSNGSVQNSDSNSYKNESISSGRIEERKSNTGSCKTTSELSKGD